MPLDTIAARLDDALNLLMAGNRAALPRQQTLRATLAWSHALLTEPEQAVLRRLSVLVGGGALAAAVAVCVGPRGDGIAPGAVLELLARLVAQSLLLLEGEGDTVRYRLLETVRQFAAEHLDAAGEAAAVRERHAAYILTVTTAAKEGLGGSEQGAWMAALDADLGNVRAALAWSRATAASERGLRIAGNIWRFWYIRGRFSEGLSWLSTFLDAPDTAAQPQARLDALFAAGRLSIFAGDYDAAQSLLTEMLALGRQHAQSLAIASALNLLGTISFEKQAFHDARARYIESLDYARASGDAYMIALTANSVAVPTIMLGEIAQAEAIFAASLSLYHALGDTSELSRVNRWLGIIAMEQGDAARARACFTEGLTAHRQMRSFVGIAECLEGLAALAVREGACAHALVLSGAADTIRATIGSPCPPYWHDWLLPRLAAASRALGAEASAAARAAGAAMTMDQACTHAMMERPPLRAAHDPFPRTQTNRRAAKRWYGGLTAREREITALVADDRSNREIADTLFIAEKTVEAHIGHALRKLGFARRAQLGEWAITTGLVTAPDLMDDAIDNLNSDIAGRHVPE